MLVVGERLDLVVEPGDQDPAIGTLSAAMIRRGRRPGQRRKKVHVPQPARRIFNRHRQCALPQMVERFWLSCSIAHRL